jgi:preprotein translocase subunit SecD
MNHYPPWKYLLIGAVIFVCALYALPNLFGNDPAVQISPAYARDMKIDETVQTTVEAKLGEAGIEFTRVDWTPKQLLVRFKDTDTQLKAYTLLKEAMSKYVVAQNLAPATPDWLRALGGLPMYLGLDLRGGVHFLMQVDMETAITQDEETYINEFRTLFREKKLRYKGSIIRVKDGSGILVVFDTLEKREQAKKLIEKQYDDLAIAEQEGAAEDEYRLYLTFTEKALDENRRCYAQRDYEKHAVKPSHSIFKHIRGSSFCAQKLEPRKMMHHFELCYKYFWLPTCIDFSSFLLSSELEMTLTKTMGFRSGTYW